MAGKLLAHVRQQWIGVIALLLVLTGGTAYALDGSNTVFTDDIVNGDVKVADIGQGAVTTDEIANNQVKAGDIGDGEVRAADIGNGQVAADEVADGQVRTQEIGNGQVQAQDLAAGVAPGASGARAWGLVDDDTSLLRSKNITAVTTRDPDAGVFCIDPGPGIDPDTAVMVVGEDSALNGTSLGGDNIALSEWDSTPTDCPDGAMEVDTFQGNGIPSNGADIDIGGFDLVPRSHGFTFVIP